MTARRAVGTVALALIAGAALAAAGRALPLPPVGDPGRLGSWWTDRGPAVAAFSVMRLAGLIGAGYLALVGSVALLGVLTRWRWTLSLSRWMARPALTRFLVGGSLVAALSAPAEALAHPASMLAVTDTGPAATPADASAGLAVTDTGPAAMRTRTAVEAATAEFTIADTGPGETQPRTTPAAAAGFTIADTGPGGTQPRTTPAAAAGFTDTVTGPGAMRSEPAEAGTGLTIADIGPSRASIQSTAVTGVDNPAAKAWITGTGGTFDDPGAATSTAQHRPAEMQAAEDPATADPGPETWIVEAGDHLWAIAAETVADRTGHTDDESVGAYWQRLIEANRHVVGDDPDLIHPGQIIELPE